MFVVIKHLQFKKDLRKEYTKILKAENPFIQKERVYYNYKLRSYVVTTNVEHMVCHFQQDCKLEYRPKESLVDSTINENIDSLSIDNNHSNDNNSDFINSNDLYELSTNREISLNEILLDSPQEKEASSKHGRVTFNNQERKWQVRVENIDNSNSDNNVIVEEIVVRNLPFPGENKNPIKTRRIRRFSGNEAEDEIDGEDTDFVEMDFTNKNQSKVFTQLIDKSRVCERSIQTSFNEFREIGLYTESPISDEFNVSVTQATIYDKYLEEVFKTEKGLFGNSKFNKSKSISQINTKRLTPIPYGHEGIGSLLRSLVVLERMLYHNVSTEILLDFSDWDDPADEIRKSNTGTLLPLWKIKCSKLAQKYELNAKMIISGEQNQISGTVTDMKWCPRYNDLLVLTIGHYNFSIHSMHGNICGFSLRNLKVPEFVIYTISGAMCLDIHRSRSNYVAVGFYNGSVAVYNIAQHKAKNHGLICRSLCREIHHIDSVTSVKWIYETAANFDQSTANLKQIYDLKFLSVGEDGKVILWKISEDGVGQIHLITNNIYSWLENEMKLDVKNFNVKFENQSENISSFDIHEDGITYIIGTKIGHIIQSKLSRELINARQSSNPEIFGPNKIAHTGMVTSIMWNFYHPNVFLSASLDGSIKVWSTLNLEGHVLDIDLKNDVTDAKWSCHSATVLAAVTADLMIYVYDLLISEDSPLCCHTLISSKKIYSVFLTKILFNPNHHTITVSDSRGIVVIYKMSPNLRKKPKERKGIEVNRGPKFERENLQHVIDRF